MMFRRVYSPGLIDDLESSGHERRRPRGLWHESALAREGFG